MTHIICNRIDNGYVARLFESRLDDCGNVSFDLIFKSEFICGIHSETYVKEQFVRTQEKIKLKEKLVEMIWVDLEKNNHWFCSEPRLKTCNISDFLEYYEFFSQHQSFRSIEFYSLSYFLDYAYETLRNRIDKCIMFEDLIDYISYGHRKKSVRLALYQNYEISIRRTKNYDPQADMIICRSFDDPNLICRLINTPVKYELFCGISMTYAIHFLRSLQKHYSPSSIVTSIESSTSHTCNVSRPMWVHTMYIVNRLSITSECTFNKYFKKVKMNAKSLHDELIRINRIRQIEQADKLFYSYTQAEYQVEINIHHLKFKLVKSKLKLYDWGNILHNCLFGFHEHIINKWGLILGVFIDDVLTYAVEFDGKTIREASGKYNKHIPKNDMEYINQWKDKALDCLKDCAYGAFLSNPHALRN